MGRRSQLYNTLERRRISFSFKDKQNFKNTKTYLPYLKFYCWNLFLQKNILRSGFKNYKIIFAKSFQLIFHTFQELNINFLLLFSYQNCCNFYFISYHFETQIEQIIFNIFVAIFLQKKKKNHKKSFCTYFSLREFKNFRVGNKDNF